MNRIIISILIPLLWLGGCKTTEVVVQKPDTFVVPKEHFRDISVFDPFPEIGSVRDINGILIGSGVLIAPDVVLTAGHVIDDPTPFMFRINGEDVLIKQTIVHPRYSNGWGIHNDIGLIILECEVDVILAELHNEGRIAQYSPLITIGFGEGYKRQSLPGTFFYYGTLMRDPTQMKFLPLKDTIWFGDSGGAVYGIVNGEFVLVGIMSSFSFTHDDIFENSATKVSFYYNWIIEEVLKNEIGEIDKTTEDGG